MAIAKGLTKRLQFETLMFSTWQRILGSCVLIGLSCGLATVVVEGATRLFFPVSDFFWEWDPMIGMKLIPGKEGRSVKKGSFDVRVRVNSVGFRDHEHPVEREQPTRRIVLLGDSFLEAIQVPFEESLTARLENRLQDTEVINLSVSGAGTAREYLTLREYGLRYSPDLVLLFFVGNDVSDNSVRLKEVTYLPYPMINSEGLLARDEAGQALFTSFSDESSWLSRVGTPLRDYSKAYRLLREIMARGSAIPRLFDWLVSPSGLSERLSVPSGNNFGFYEIYRLTPKPVWEEAWRLTEQLIVATRDLAHAHGAEFAVVLIPAAWEVDSMHWEGVLNQLPGMRKSPVSREQPSARLTQFLAIHDVPVFDLLAEFRNYAATRPPLYFQSDAHWTSAGHKLAADLLTEDVSGFLPSPSSAPQAFVD